MGKMSWLHHLVQQAHTTGQKKELEEHLGDLKFRNPRTAANHFLTAFAELKENALKVGIGEESEPNDPDDGSWKGR